MSVINNLAFFVKGRTLPRGFALSEDSEAVVSELARRLYEAGIIESEVPLESTKKIWTFRAGPILSMAIGFPQFWPPKSRGWTGNSSASAMGGGGLCHSRNQANSEGMAPFSR